jgi:hypothetical protein
LWRHLDGAPGRKQSQLCKSVFNLGVKDRVASKHIKIIEQLAFGKSSEANSDKITA